MNRTLLLFALLYCSAAAFSQEPKDLAKKLQERLASLAIAPHLDQPYAGNTNQKQMLDLFLPKQPKSTKPLPVVVHIHGGGWLHGDRNASAGGVLRYVQSGEYAGVAISYRLSDEAKWPAQIYDCKAAIRWIRGHAKEYNLDPERIGVFGSSAGGHLVSLLGTSGGVKELEGDLGEFPALSSRVTCVVNMCGPEDLTMPLMSRNRTLVTEDPAVTGLLGGSMSAKHAEAVAASPVTYVTPDDASFLTLHGTKDERVAFKQGELIHAALKQAGVPSVFVPVVDGGHSMGHPQISERMSKFFAKYLKSEPMEISEEPLLPVPVPK